MILQVLNIQTVLFGSSEANVVSGLCIFLVACLFLLFLILSICLCYISGCPFYSLASWIKYIYENVSEKHSKNSFTKHVGTNKSHLKSVKARESSCDLLETLPCSLYA